MKDLVVVETLTPEVFVAPGGIDALIAKLEADLRAVETDISTPKGRKEIASLAFKVSRSKTALDDMGKELVADLKKQTGAVDAERRKVRERLDALRDEVRKPLDDYEAIEATRIADHEAAITAIREIGTIAVAEPTSADVRARLSQLSNLEPRDWQEFTKRAETARSEAFASLTIMKETAIAREAADAETARLAAEAAARAQREREARIAVDAAKAARLAAEAKAKQDVAEAEARAAEAQQIIERQRLAAIQRAEKAERDAAEAKVRAERDRLAAEADAEQKRRLAVEEERQRAANAAEEERIGVEARERNKSHKKRINSEALSALVHAGLTEAQGIIAITSIVKGDVPHIRISY